VLQELVNAGFPPAVELFGPTVSVQEMIKFVQANCSERSGCDRQILRSPDRRHAGEPISGVSRDAPPGQVDVARIARVWAQWQWKNSLTVPFGRPLKWSVTWFVNVDPSEPVPRTLKVNVPSTTLPLSLKPPQTVNLPV
jgi:hypothetical protein